MVPELHSADFYNTDPFILSTEDTDKDSSTPRAHSVMLRVPMPLCLFTLQNNTKACAIIIYFPAQISEVWN